MIADRKFELAALLAFLAKTERHDQELRAVIASSLIDPETRMQALVDLAQLSSGLTSLLAEVIEAASESRQGPQGSAKFQ